ncbi:hypothetical protein KL918_001279 [Ogataea parapolymorpha]|uniref:Increased rDNA silencing protein 4 n=1 Tax=Ogataea parapolymorpha (strain ATCC 26012 / BCRC 20466 / JCM 22074 / NRRL Y-7560 / DL-1) TaxID=871575 RepID=W1QHJ2_OGAPD|nr:Increased rDNA silencing protein 4 [Ogataea parapolymorpha DL-1]ESW99785.1 Increased rDNA silencing protein 4 [Ogataea parapolymorpha DL-1]KAG7868636.1 hypothetical protein KL918_001279 [Ogataea parapolymorpha]KAG7874582.1 hypothetical protein KL916_001348 [Ogataea parapolymorpha]
MNMDSSLAAKAAVRKQSSQTASANEIVPHTASLARIKKANPQPILRNSHPRKSDGSASSVSSVRTKQTPVPSSADWGKRPSTPGKHASRTTWDSVNSNSSSAALAAASLVAKSKPSLMVSTSQPKLSTTPENLSSPSIRPVPVSLSSHSIPNLKSPNFGTAKPLSTNDPIPPHPDFYTDPLSKSPYNNSSPNRSAKSSVHSLSSSLKDDIKLLSPPPKVSHDGSISTSNSYSSLSLPMISEDEDYLYKDAPEEPSSSYSNWDLSYDFPKHALNQLPEPATIADYYDQNPSDNEKFDTKRPLSRKPPPAVEVNESTSILKEPAFAEPVVDDMPVSGDEALPQYPVSPVAEYRLPHHHHGLVRGAHGKKFQRMLGLQRHDSSQSTFPVPAEQDQHLKFKTTLRKEKHTKKGFNEAKPWKHHNDANYVTEEEKKRYEGVWAANKGSYVDDREESIVADAGQRIHGLVVRELWRRSRLSDETLERIWDLLIEHRKKEYFARQQDQDEQHDDLEFDDGTLTKEEFILGTWLVDQCLYGRKLPPTIHDELWNSVETRASVIVKPKKGNSRRKREKMLKKVGMA